jgi:glucose/arabinose dehydrogenase
MHRITTISWLTIVALLFLSATQIFSQVLLPDFKRIQVGGDIPNPTVIAFAPDGRIFIAQQSGTIRIIKNDSLLINPFYKVKVNVKGERGLIGMTLDPDFANNQYVYLYYTLPSASRNRIIRITGNGDAAVAGSEQAILELSPLSSASNHNGGAMHFKDGKLYVAIGENGNKAHAQNLDTYHGKVLRINPDGSAPVDNPFPEGSEQRKRIWGYGFRNPFTFDVQPGSNRIFVNDVGARSREEINDVTEGGKNFGWPLAEGSSTDTTLTNPIFFYSHGKGNFRGCAITGGTFFNPDSTSYPAKYIGKYFYQDLCNHWINMLTLTESPVTNELFATGLGANALAVHVGTDGNLYYLERGTGVGHLFKIIYNKAPEIVSQPLSDTVLQRKSVTFSVTATGTATIHYQWKKNDQEIVGATASSFTIEKVVLADSGYYSVTIFNTADTIQSDSAKLSVIPVNAPPVANIVTPVDGFHYRGGDVIEFTGEATDEEDGILPESAFSWSVKFYHDNVISEGPSLQQGVKNGQFAIPASGEMTANAFYQLYLTVHDSKDYADSVSRDILPYTSVISLATEPPGFELLLDGQSVLTPFSVTSVEGVERTLGIVTPQQSGDEIYEFDHWEHGGTPTQLITTPTSDAIFTALFTKHQVTGIAELRKYFTVFPNPAKSQIIIEGESNNELREVKIINMEGKIVQSRSFITSRSSASSTLDVSTIPNGIYLLKIRQGKAVQSKVIVIHK